ncbi:unnamed protein product [Ciceribacter sp. T2.26MG-112.2]|nr:unnamed protein product [Ciceribacter naphthalenivorans]
MSFAGKSTIYQHIERNAALPAQGLLLGLAGGRVKGGMPFSPRDCPGIVCK